MTSLHSLLPLGVAVVLTPIFGTQPAVVEAGAGTDRAMNGSEGCSRILGLGLC